MMHKRLLWWYVGIGLALGLIVGALGRHVLVRWLVPLVVAIGAVALFMYADDMSREEKHVMDGGDDHGREEAATEEDVKILAKDEAREWLDEFLVEQQGQRDQ